MMAAVAPRLLRALRIQTLRGPPWPRRSPLAFSSAPRAMATASTQAAPSTTVAQNPPELGQNPPELGQNPPVLSQNPPELSQNLQVLGQNPSDLGQNPLDLGQNPPELGQNLQVLGQNPSDLGQNPSDLGQNPQVLSQNPPELGQNPSDLGQNPSDLGQNPLDLGQNPLDLDQNLLGLGEEVGLKALGLGAATPVGLIQNFLEFLHVEVGLPWWGAIAVGTLCVRVSLLPLLIRGQREASRLSSHLPHLQTLSQRLAEARRGSDQAQVARAYSELVRYQQKHNVNPLRGFLVPLVQTPVFISFFLALQQMAAAPVPGLRWGGLGWCRDLTAPDPFYVLPIVVTASTWAVLEIGAEAGLSAPSAGVVRLLLRFLPLLFLPFILHFPTAVFTYWLTSNAFSLGQATLLRIPGFRAKLGFSPQNGKSPKMTQNVTGDPKEKMGVVERVKREWKEAQAEHRGEQRRWRLRHHLDLAAKGPLRQTFARNPLAPPNPPEPPKPPKRPWKETLG